MYTIFLKSKYKKISWKKIRKGYNDQVCKKLIKQYLIKIAILLISTK